MQESWRDRITKKQPTLLVAFMRCLADSNRRRRFCRPLTKPLIQGTVASFLICGCKGTTFYLFYQMFCTLFSLSFCFYLLFPSFILFLSLFYPFFYLSYPFFFAVLACRILSRPFFWLVIAWSVIATFLVFKKFLDMFFWARIFKRATIATASRIFYNHPYAPCAIREGDE